jgi:hypothetical protein
MKVRNVQSPDLYWSERTRAVKATAVIQNCVTPFDNGVDEMTDIEKVAARLTNVAVDPVYFDREELMNARLKRLDHVTDLRTQTWSSADHERNGGIVGGIALIWNIVGTQRRLRLRLGTDRFARRAVLDDHFLARREMHAHLAPGIGRRILHNTWR